MVLFMAHTTNTQDLMLAQDLLVPVLAGVLKRLTVQVMLKNMHP